MPNPARHFIVLKKIACVFRLLCVNIYASTYALFICEKSFVCFVPASQGFVLYFRLRGSVRIISCIVS